MISLLLEILKREYSEKEAFRQVSNDIMSNCINIIIGIRSIFVKIILISAFKTIWNQSLFNRNWPSFVLPGPEKKIIRD